MGAIIVLGSVIQIKVFMKNIFLLLVCFLPFVNTYGQENQKEKKLSSKMLDFVSKTGVLIKFEDYNLPNLKSKYGIANVKIRKIYSGNEEKFFLQISNKGKYGANNASVAHEDIREIQKAITTLKNQSTEDMISKSDYLENKFVTDDGFEVGYLVNNGKITWYLTLEKNSSGSTLFFKDLTSTIEMFNSSITKIEKLK